MPEFADFGSQSEHYVLGRREYPDTVFYYLKTFVQEKEPILDLGCGTGISTRQLARHGFEDLQGIDKDEKMLEEAREHRQYKHILYFQAMSDKLPLKSNSIKAVTCFSSFHWFSNPESVYEIKRVLKKLGVLFIVNKKDRTPLKEEIQEKITKAFDIYFPEITPLDKSVELLTKQGLEVIPPKYFEGEDLYSLPEAIDYIQSTSFFAAIPENKQKQILEEIVKPVLSEKLKWDRIARKYDAVCLVAQKKY